MKKLSLSKKEIALVFAAAVINIALIFVFILLIVMFTSFCTRLEGGI